MQSSAMGDRSPRSVGLVAWAIVAPIVTVILVCLGTQRWSQSTAISGNLLLLCSAIGGAFAFFMRKPVWKRFLVFAVYLIFSFPAVLLLGLYIWCAVSGNCL